MSRQQESQTQIWSCGTLDDGLEHLKDDSILDEEARLLKELEAGLNLQ